MKSCMAMVLVSGPANALMRAAASMWIRPFCLPDGLAQIMFETQRRGTYATPSTPAACAIQCGRVTGAALDRPQNRGKIGGLSMRFSENHQ